MFKYLLLGAIFYFLYQFYTKSKALFKGQNNGKLKKDIYKKFDIKDAEFEDLDEKEG